MAARATWRRVVALSLCGLLAACAMTAERTAARTDADADARRQVEATERAFARSMAERDLPAFTTFLSDEAIFFADATPLRGKPAVIAHWRRFFDGPQAPFSWEPATVEVLASGGLAISSGPVRNPAGQTVAVFTSIWRLEAPGTWRIVFDKGGPAPRAAP